MKTDYKKTGVEAVRAVGGKENISQLTHCVTRLRFQVYNEEKVDFDKLKKIPGVMDVILQGGQIQVVIGPEVQIAYHAANDVLGTTAATDDAAPEGTAFQRFLAMALAIINPMVPAIAGAGMVKAVLTLLQLAQNQGLISVAGSTFDILSFCADAAFYFMPMILAFSAAQYFKSNVSLSIVLAGVLLHPNFVAMRAAGEAVTYFGLPVPLVNYASSLLPIILIVYFQSKLERLCEKVIPSCLKFILRPLCVILVMAPVGLIVLGPIGYYISQGLTIAVEYISNIAPWFIPTFFGAFFPLLVTVGLHTATTPVATAQLAAKGYDAINGPAYMASNTAEGAAAFAVACKTKSRKMRQIAISAGISSLMGITEPALYGVNLKLKKPLIAVIIGGGIGGLYAGLTGIHRYGVGATSLAGLPLFLGGNEPGDFRNAVITFVISFVATFVITLFMKFDVSPESEEDTVGYVEKKAEKKSQSLESPVQGKAIALNEVKDEVFSKGILGKGIAIEPTDNKITAPIDGTVMIPDTKHAVGITGDDGLELLIHVGIDTVKLDGKYFTTALKTGDRVKKGDVVLTFDREAMAAESYDTTVMMVVTNSSEYASVEAEAEGSVREGQKLLKLAVR